MPLKIALIGYGKMGKLIELLSDEYGGVVVSRVRGSDSVSGSALTIERLMGAEVAIEFSRPEVAAENLKRLAELKVRTVCGTTGWLDKLPEVQAAFEHHGGTLIYGANFSIGVNVFDRIVSYAAKLFSEVDQYSAWGWEAHHEQKKDAPSGTLLKLVGSMKSAGYTREIQLSSTRAGHIPGTHEVGFDSAADTITLRHTARSREGFARGALEAAKWATERQGVFEFSEVLFNGKR